MSRLNIILDIVAGSRFAGKLDIGHSSTMEPTNINKIIKVGAVFQGGNIIPKWFCHEDRKHEIKEVNYKWDDFEGMEKIMFFSVNDGTNNYEISLNLKRLIWKLNKTCINL